MGKKPCGGIHHVTLQAERHLHARTYANLHLGVRRIPFQRSRTAQRFNMGKLHVVKRCGDTDASSHIGHKTIPKNTDPTLTNLNRELVEFSDGVSDHTEARSHRIHTAGIKRNLTSDQVLAMGIVLFGIQRYMKIQDKGRLYE